MAGVETGSGPAAFSQWNLVKGQRAIWELGDDDDGVPTSRSKAAGFSDSSELSSCSGARHFWQYIFFYQRIMGMNRCSVILFKLADNDERAGAAVGLTP